MTSRTAMEIFAALCLCAARAAFSADEFAFFEARIRPVLVEHCYECHSAQSGKAKGGLQLDSRDALLKGGENGPVIVPGNPDESRLIRAIRYTDDKLQMPPKDKKLPAGVIADFEAWVRAGAPDPRTNTTPRAPAAKIAEARRHWPFVPPAHPSPPHVEQTGWVQNEVDRFILAKLEEKHLSPAKQADKRTLIRRAAFDLTGLPPTPEEVQAFLHDDSPEAFARVVDRLLASPAYGERWARHWLDVVRYTDSLDSRAVGSEGDITEAYRYRDWVVQAFNSDLPYDQFVFQQIAGDLIPPPSPESLNTNGVIATGVYAIGEWGTGDADKEKMLTDIVDDQIDLTGRAFLGLTLACARCHDHKFDPISNEDYYALAGIFFSSHIVPNPGVKTAGTPVSRIPLVPKTEVERRKDLERRIDELAKQMDVLKDETIRAYAARSLPQTARALEALWQWKHSAAASRPELKSLAATNDIDEAVLLAWRDLLGWNEMKLLTRLSRDIAGKKGVDSWNLPGGPDTPSVTINSTDEPVPITTLTLPPRSVSAHPSPRGGVAVAWKAPASGTFKFKATLTDADDKCGDGVDWALRVVAAERRKELAKGAIENGKAADLPSQSVELKRGDFLELIVGPKGGYECDTTTIAFSIEGEEKTWDLATDILAAPRANPAADRFNAASVWHFYDAAGQKASSDVLAGSRLEPWLTETNASQRTRLASDFQTALLALSNGPNSNDADSKLLDKWANPRSDVWNAVRSDFSLISRELPATLADLNSRREKLLGQLPPPFPVAHGFQEGGTPESAHAGFHDARIHIRGRYDRLGEVVPRHFPRVLAGDELPSIPPKSSGRLQLARWVASCDNPMTARVMVNRIWQHHFGEGIVRTPNNFGKLGTAPTHPELLDYLANRFVESGWSVKAMHRLIMLSSTWQQSSIPEPRTREADPDNLLFGRMNRRRLESEPIRDSLLAAAGELNLAQGGLSIRDLQTARRTLYVMTIRSDRATYQSLFDAADPTAIVDKRIDSTVAPQALFLLNNSFVLKRAESLARRVDGLPGSVESRIHWLYETLYSRPPSTREVEIGLQALEAEKGDWTAYCQILLAANEFVYID